MTLDELDRLAAEKVMGWYVLRTDTSVASDVYSVWASPSCSDHYQVGQWQPTRNIAQAFELLEKFEDEVEISSLIIGEWRCTVNDFWAVGPTAAEAITRACLRAKGVEI